MAPRRLSGAVPRNWSARRSGIIACPRPVSKPNSHGRRLLSRRQCAVGCFQSHRLRRSAESIGAATADRDYARMEMFALLLSWLANPGCPVINRPAPNALAGSAYRPPMWHRLAQIAGLTTVSLVATSSTRRFPVDRTAARRADITIRSRLTRMASRDRTTSHGFPSRSARSAPQS